MPTTVLFGLAAGLAVGGAPAAKDLGERPGPLLLIGGRHQDLTADLYDAFVALAGGPKARIVVIPTATADAEVAKVDQFLKPWEDRAPLSVRLLHTRDPKMADDPAFVRPLTEATAVFITNGHRHRLFDAYQNTLVAAELKKLHARGGLIGGTGTGAVVLGDLMSNRDKAVRPADPGFGLLPGFLIEDGEHFAEAGAANPAYVGLSIGAGTAVEVRGRTLRVLGTGTVTVRLAKGAGEELKVEPLKAGAKLDVNDLRRAAARRGGKTKE